MKEKKSLLLWNQSQYPIYDQLDEADGEGGIG